MAVVENEKKTCNPGQEFIDQSTVNSQDVDKFIEFIKEKWEKINPIEKLYIATIFQSATLSNEEIVDVVESQLSPTIIRTDKPIRFNSVLMKFGQDLRRMNWK